MATACPAQTPPRHRHRKTRTREQSQDEFIDDAHDGEGPGGFADAADVEEDQPAAETQLEVESRQPAGVEEEVSPASLAELAREVNSLHANVVRHQRCSNAAALRIGELLIEARLRVKRPKFGEWLRDNVQVEERQARRYRQLAEGREQLDRINANWMDELSLTQAVALLAEPSEARANARTALDPRFTAPYRNGTAGHTARPACQADEQEREPPDIPQLLKEATAAHRLRVKKLPELLGLIGFTEGSEGFYALQRLRRSILVAAWRAVEHVPSDWLNAVGFDREAIGMALLVKLLKETPVRELFAPTEADIVEQLEMG